jgi:DNA-3-methyladenine glycosylase I
MKNKIRCKWCLSSDKMIAYHDKQWGVPVHDDRLLFEYIVLDAFQAGLSWSTILNKRENFEKAFDKFDAKKISKYNNEKLAELMNDAGIIRNRSKINSTIGNAKAFLEIQKEFGSFDKFIWQFTKGKTINNKLNDMTPIPARSVESDAMSKELIKRGFKFVGSTICYAFMQASGMVNDHHVDCFRHDEV